MTIAPADRFKMVVAVHLVLRAGNKILLGQRQNTGWADGSYHLFGGHIEENELASAALVREGLEELGITIDPKKIKLVHVRNILRADHSRLHLYFAIDQWSGNVIIKEPALCAALEWFDLAKLPTNITQDAKETLESIEKGIYYAENQTND